MAIRDYWIYQKRNVAIPWALYVVKEYDRRYPSATCLDYTLYHEDIDKPTHCVSRVCVHYDTVSGYVSDIAETIMDNTPLDFTHEDSEQLERSILNILKD